MACFVNNYPLTSDLSIGWLYSAFVQLGPEQSELTVVSQNNSRGPSVDFELFSPYFVIINCFSLGNSQD